MRQTSMHNAQRHAHASRHRSRSPTHLPHTQCAHTSHPPRPVVWAEQSGLSETTDGEAPAVSNGGAVPLKALRWVSLRSSTGDERACASRLRQAELRRSKVEGRERERLVAAAAAAASDAEAAERRVRMLCEHWNGTAKRRAVQSAGHRIATESSRRLCTLGSQSLPRAALAGWLAGWLWSAQRARELAGNRQPLHLQCSLCHSGTLCSRFCAYGKCRRSPR